ncbi:MAG: hypothetical protein ACQETH_05570 [Candidatus Rifleibacteriota bacterium]
MPAAINRVDYQASFCSNGLKANSPKQNSQSFNPDLASEEEKSLQAAPTRQSNSNVRVLTSVDKSILRDIEKEFGIKPLKPGDDLLKARNSMWTLASDDNVITGAEMEKNADKAVKIFKKHLSNWMRDEEISPEPPIDINIAAGSGKIRVNEDHPDKEKIENFINGNSELRNLYVGISNSKNLTAMGKESHKFQQKYAVDPKAAVDEFSHLFSGNYGYKTSLKISADSWDFSTGSYFKIT